MKIKFAILSVTAAMVLSGCTSSRVQVEVPVPREEIGRGDEGGWKPYSPPRPEARPERVPQLRDDSWGAARRSVRDEAVRREPVSRALPRFETGNDPLRDRPSAASVRVDRPESAPFVRAEPKDPPTDPTRRRVYSSRPDRSAATAPVAASASPTRSVADGPRDNSTPQPRRRSGIRSEWADKAVRADNRPSFDRMVSESARLGKGSFEDEAGRIYYGERRGSEDGCAVVDVTVTTDGGLPVVSRGLAYDCR